MAYTTVDHIENKLGRDLTATETAYFTNVLDAYIDAYIDSMTETSFGSTVSTSVYVESEGGSSLIIPTMHDITAVNKLLDDDTLELVPTTEYYTYPRGGDDVLALKRKHGSWEDGATYVITGELGYKAIPADITGVATDLATNFITSNIHNYKSEKVGDWSVTYAEADDSLTVAGVGVLAGYKRLSRSV